jgi:hypothetical protein
MVIKANVTKEVYKADDGQEYRYYQILADIDGQQVRLYVQKKDKRVVNYILDKIYR